MSKDPEQAAIEKTNACQHLWVTKDANENGGYARILCNCVKCNDWRWFEERDAKTFPRCILEEDREALRKDPVYKMYIK
jgi:hypothetical protein